MARVTIAIVSWNAREWLERCLESLRPFHHEIIVVDNDSRDGSADLVAGAYPEVMLLRQPANIGFGAAVNLASYRARAPYLLLLNSDARPAGGAVDRLADFLDAHADCGAVGGLLVGSDSVPQYGFTVRRFPSLASIAADLLLLDHVWPANPVSRRYQARDLDLSRPIEVDQPAAAALMVRLDAFRRVGRMDERFYPAWFDDVDLCRRLKRAGWRIFLEPAARFEHRGGVAMRTMGLRAFTDAWYRNLLLYVRKHHGRAPAFVVRILLAAGMVERASAACMRRDSPSLRAYLAVLRFALRGDRRISR